MEEQEPTMVSPAALAETGIVETAPTAWSDSDDITEPEPFDDPGRRNWLISGVIFAATAAVAALVGAGAYIYFRDDNTRAPTSQEPAAPAPKDEPVNELDRDFMSRVSQLHIPADDWRYYTSMARSLCETAQEGEPPGNFGFEIIRQVVEKKEPKWTQPQVYGFTATTYETYCPKMWGPTEAELAAMAPNDRLIALLGSRAGLMPANPEQVQSVITATQNVCQSLDSGQSRSAITERVHAENSGRTGSWTYDTSKTVVEVSIEVLCPQNK